MARNYSSISEAKTLAGNVTEASTTLTVNETTTGLPTVPFVFVINPDTALEEAVLATAKAGSTYTITRNIEGGGVKSHTLGQTVRHMIVGSDLQIVHDHVDNTTTAHGINSKAPLASPTFTGTVVLPSTTSIGNVSAAQIGYVYGVTSAIQTQLNTLTTSISTAVPAGVITQFGGSTAPTGWVLCDGTAYPRTGTYANLFGAINTAYGAGDGSTFNVPNLKGRVPVGKDTTANITFTITNKALTSNVATLTTSVAHDLVVGDSITVASVDATFNGTYTVTGTTTTTFSYAKTASNVLSTAASGTVVATNLPFDLLGETGGETKHRLLEGEVGVHSHPGQIVFDVVAPIETGTSGVKATGIGDTQPNTGSNGGGGVHNNLQPYIVVNYIIKY